RLPVRVVLLFLLKRRRRVRDLVAFDDALSRGNAEPCAVILNIPCRGIEHLPEAGDVRLTVCSLGRRVCGTSCGSLSCRHVRGGQECERCHRRGDREPDEPVSHPGTLLRGAIYDERL